MPWYRTEDGRGIVHVHVGRRAAPAMCRATRFAEDNPQHGDACGRVSAWQCAALVGHDVDGTALACGMPVCERHATRVGTSDVVYCPRHRGLALAPPARR